jgi:O-antigen ligase
MKLSDKILFWGFLCVFFFAPVATSPLVIAGILSLCVWVFSGKFIKERDRWLRQDWAKPVAVLILLPWIGLLWSEDMETGLSFAKKSYYWLYAFAVASLTLRHSVEPLLKAFIAGLFIISAVSVMQFAGVIPLGGKLPTVFSGKSITASLLLVFGMLILSFYFTKADGLKRKGLIVFLLIFFFLALSAGSGRAGYLAFVLLSPLMVYNFLGQKHIIKVIVFTGLAVGMLFLSPVVQSRVAEVAKDIKAYHEMNPNTSVGLRLHMWSGAIKIFLENPVIGTGTGGYQSAMRKYKIPQLAPEFQEFTQPHNSFLYMAANFGIVGLITLLWLFAVLLRNGWQNRKDIAGFSILSFTLVVLIGSLTDTQILSVATGILFAAFTGLQTVLVREQGNEG